MNTRIAKKILSQPTDPARKPSAVLPYTDQQIVEAWRVHRLAVRRAIKAQPGVDRMDLRIKWDPSRASIPRRERRGVRRIEDARNRLSEAAALIRRAAAWASTHTLAHHDMTVAPLEALADRVERGAFGRARVPDEPNRPWTSVIEWAEAHGVSVCGGE